MPRSTLIFPAVLAAAVLAAAPMPAKAQSGKTEPEALLEEGTKKILRAFELFIQTIPQYEMPEVLPNGDIIIRRKNPAGQGQGGEKPPAGEREKT